MLKLQEYIVHYKDNGTSTDFILAISINDATKKFKRKYPNTTIITVNVVDTKPKRAPIPDRPKKR